jgi:hypothetical protein
MPPEGVDMGSGAVVAGLSVVGVAAGEVGSSGEGDGESSTALPPETGPDVSKGMTTSSVITMGSRSTYSMIGSTLC